MKRIKILCPSGSHYVRAFRDGILDANAAAASTWETFEMEQFADGRVAFRTLPGHPKPDQYVRAQAGGGGKLSADRSTPNDHEKFELEDLGSGKTAIRTQDGHFWRAKQLGGAELDCAATERSSWEAFKIEEIV